MTNNTKPTNRLENLIGDVQTFYSNQEAKTRIRQERRQK